VATKEKPDLVSDSAALTFPAELEPLPPDGVEVHARGYWEGVWLRLRRDKVAIAGGIFIIFLILFAFIGAPLVKKVLGHGPNDLFPYPGTGGIDENLLPKGPMSYVQDPINGTKELFILGSDGSLGRDEFLRIIYGAQVSIEVAFGATFLSMLFGVIMGSLAGFYGGWTDTLISRVTEITMCFPYLLFVIAVASTVGSRIDHITFGFLGEGVLTLILVFGFLSWFYAARVFRGIVLSLREKEFVEAARMVGSSNLRIVRSHVLPHLVGPIIVLSTLNVAQFVLAEAGLSFLGLGIKLPTASWGNLLAAAPDYYATDPLLMLWPGLALIATTLAFNLLGDGLRDAFDPRATR
jgi:ABC-type dipeptide/oligopeptide/nickel transport system permease subunit